MNLYSRERDCGLQISLGVKSSSPKLFFLLTNFAVRKLVGGVTSSSPTGGDSPTTPGLVVYGVGCCKLGIILWHPLKEGVLRVISGALTTPKFLLLPLPRKFFCEFSFCLKKRHLDCPAILLMRSEIKVVWRKQSRRSSVDWLVVAALSSPMKR